MDIKCLAQGPNTHSDSTGGDWSRTSNPSIPSLDRSTRDYPFILYRFHRNFSHVTDSLLKTDTFYGDYYDVNTIGPRRDKTSLRGFRQS